jgi:hypothetical protein
MVAKGFSVKPGRLDRVFVMECVAVLAWSGKHKASPLFHEEGAQLCQT